ncbi:MAG: alpha-L-arabinofuranosidase C-terminal domain-containing protein [bacterium]|nr:alpha-L-arabinofuranosidase C-terminal domain-containing protein [bacterium]
MKTKHLLYTAFVFLMLVAVPASNLRGSATVVNVDATTTQPPISPYIYGQFIEHLGRCIYGGLWAEMLEDRKFFFPITGEAPPWTLFKPGERSWDGEGHPYELLTRSPWLIIGPREAVAMVREGVYVGEHTPEITLVGDGERRGIVQERLSLIEGKGYMGRIVLAGDASAAPVEIILVWGGGASDRQTVTIDRVDAEYVKSPLDFTARGTTDNGRLEIVGRGKGRLRIGAVSLMPADNIYGWRADTVALLKELNSPVYRWPGGNFVSGYDWKDGVGDPDRRLPRKNPAWKGIEHNDVGIHEFLALCREIGAEAYIAVNTGLGQAEAAAAEVEYVNGDPNTPMGSWRARNGYPQPFGVKWWAIGNEMFGDWQLGHMPLEQYLKKHNQVVEAMRAVDPNISVVGVGAVGEWSRGMLTHCSDHMDLISEHLYWQDRDDVVAHVAQVTREIRRVAEAHRAYRKELGSLKGEDIRVAMDEWNYWYGPNEYGELGTRYFLQDGLGIAAGLHEFFRNSDIYFMANYAQTVNVIGAIKTTATEAAFETTGMVLKLYRERFGVTPVKVEGDFAPLDVAAAWNADRTAITVAIVNPASEPRQIALQVAGCKLAGYGRQWVMTGPSKWSYNAPGKAPQVTLDCRSIPQGADLLQVLPLSVTLVELPVQ